MKNRRTFGRESLQWKLYWGIQLGYHIPSGSHILHFLMEIMSTSNESRPATNSCQGNLISQVAQLQSFICKYAIQYGPAVWQLLFATERERAISIQRALSPDDSTLSFVEIFRLVQAVRIYPKFLAAVVSFLLLTSKAHRHGSCCLPFILSYNVILILAGKKLHNASSTAPLIEEVAKGCTSSRRRLAPVTNSAEKFFATGPPSVHCQNVHMPEIALYIHNRRILIQRI